MALRNQPYLPLYVQDFNSDERLCECSASATGVYIRLLCILHKCEEYGKITLKEKERGGIVLLDFATKLARQMPYDVDTIYDGLKELYEEDVIQVEGYTLSQRRMVKDAELSEKRAVAGVKGYEAKITHSEKKQAEDKPKRDVKPKETAPQTPLDKAYADYIEMRKKIKKPMTDRAIKLLKNKVDEIGRNEAEKIHILEEATMHNWLSVYRDKDYRVVEEKEDMPTDNISMDELRALMEGL